MADRLLVASVVDLVYNGQPKVAAVRAVLERWGFESHHVVDEQWFGWPSKMLGLIQIVKEAAEEGKYSHIMFIDGADVVALAGPDEVMRRYREFNHPWVYNAEPFIWSQGSFEPGDYPTPICTYRYLNSGASVGEIGHINACFDKWTDHGRKPPLCHKGDQDWMAARFIEDYPYAMMLDHRCKLFQVMCGSLVEPKPKCTMIPGRVHNNETGTDPIIIHFNGGDDITVPERRFLWDCLI